MDIRQRLTAIQSDLQVVKAARATSASKITGMEASFRRLSEMSSPSAVGRPTIVAAEASYDTVYINRLREVLNSPKTGAIDITIRGR